MEPTAAPPPTEPAGGGTIVLSAHSDDAALSLGGSLLLGVYPAPVTLVTVFGRSNYIDNGFHPDPDRATARRRREDEAFARASGHRLCYLEVPEAALRDFDHGDRIFATDPREKFSGPNEVAPALSRIFDSERPSLVLAPLGLGCHRDHLLLQRAAPALAARRSARLAYYEDLPYAAALTEEAILRHARTIDMSLECRTLDVTTTMARKLAALDLYSSQRLEGHATQSVERQAWRRGNWLDRFHHLGVGAWRRTRFPALERIWAPPGSKIR